MSDHKTPKAVFVAVEYDQRRERVVQCYGANNSKPSKPVSDFVNLVFAGLSSDRKAVAE